MVNWLRRIRIKRLKVMIAGLMSARDDLYFLVAQPYTNQCVELYREIIKTTKLLAEFEEKLRQLKEDT